MLDTTTLLQNQYFLGIFTFLVSLLLAIRAFPVVVNLSREKDLMATPGDRSSHTTKTPNLGGIGIFVAFSLTIMIVAGISEGVIDNLNELLLLLTGVSIMFFIGVKDDLVGMSPMKKLFGQTIAAVLVILVVGVRIEGFGGLFGVYELPYFISVLFSVLLFLFLINAFNLIDGIDGLASVIGIISSAVFGVFFMAFGEVLMMITSFILLGALLGFLRFNFSSGNKLFMGDSGSMVVGFILIYMAVRFLQLIPEEVSGVVMPNKYILVLGLLFFPILDTLRVFVIRIRDGKSPFKADKNHIHHRLLGLGLSHLQATLIIASVNIILLSIIFMIRDLPINLEFLIFVSVVFVFACVPWMIGRDKSKVVIKSTRFGKILYTWMIHMNLW